MISNSLLTLGMSNSAFCDEKANSGVGILDKISLTKSQTLDFKGGFSFLQKSSKDNI